MTRTSTSGRRRQPGRPSRREWLLNSEHALVNMQLYRRLHRLEPDPAIDEALALTRAELAALVARDSLAGARATG